MENAPSMFRQADAAAYETRPTAERVLAGAAATVLAAASAAVVYFDPSKSNMFPVCPLFALTGFACPGCGVTRGMHALSHGDIIPALDFNLLVPVWAAILLWVMVSLVVLAVRGRGVYMWPTRPRFMWTFMIVLAAFGVLRNIPAWPLTILFP